MEDRRVKEAGPKGMRPVESAGVPGFVPSSGGFHFPNAFPHGPVVRARLLSWTVEIGDAANGLCGGMVFAARDLFEQRRPPPPDRHQPPPGSTLFSYLVRRSFASLDVPWGSLRYMAWSALPERDTRLGRGLISRTVEREWPLVKRAIDSGKLPALGLIRTRSLNPFSLGRNHQVLAYGYALDEENSRLTIRVYDPNHPDDDSVAIVLSLPLGAGTRISYLDDELPVRGFFRTRYRRDRRRLRGAPPSNGDQVDAGHEREVSVL